MDSCSLLFSFAAFAVVGWIARVRATCNRIAAMIATYQTVSKLRLVGTFCERYKRCYPYPNLQPFKACSISSRRPKTPLTFSGGSHKGVKLK